jgi:hypothetical protein
MCRRCLAGHAGAGPRPAGAQLLPPRPPGASRCERPRRCGPWADALAEQLAIPAPPPPSCRPDPAPKALRGAQLIAFPGADDIARLARLAAAAEGVAEGLHLVVRDGLHDPAAAGLLALGRVLANEMPRLAPARHDLDPALSPLDAARRLAAALLTPPDAEAEQR